MISKRRNTDGLCTGDVEEGEGMVLLLGTDVRVTSEKPRVENQVQ